MPSHGTLDDPHLLNAPVTQSRLFNNNPWLAYLDENFGLAFNAFRPQTGSRAFQDFFRNRGPRIEQDFQTANARLALSGQAPNLDPTDFLRDFNFRNEFLNQTPSQRGDFSRSPRLSFGRYTGR